ncbi:hypothetical protein DFH08DRAFT_968052 [Mycena albidolilacea]|uniref:Uncharacterized protein n=1 Tax=Mycena albidolilacea TaxID=1033008 RepID=A0AAD6ZL57_9AGAR|nr:hypothetical protein DFH08DRAFT_968052 [Mycena albidolilacea]
MPRKVNTAARPVIGPPQALISRIDHLRDLLCNLPSALPENLTHSLYNFLMDPEILKEGGHFSAVSHALEISFETHLLRLQGRTMVFTEHGTRLDTLVKLLKMGVKHMSPGERTTFQEAWLERLITAAADSGARIPSKKGKGGAQETSKAADDVPAAKKCKTVAVIDVDDDSVPNNSTAVVQTMPHAATPSVSRPSASGAVIIEIDDDSEPEDTPTVPQTLLPAATPSTSAHPATSGAIVGNPKQSTLGSFGWQKAKPGEVVAYWAKAREAGAEKREKELAIHKKKAENQKERERDLARIRKQRQRKKERQGKPTKSEKKLDATALLMQGADAAAHGSSTIPDVASLSHPATQGWKKYRRGTQGGAVQGKAQKVFWFDPFLWAIIEPAVRRHGWSAEAMVKALCHKHPVLFDGPNNKFHRSTLWNQRSLAGSGRTGILTPHPEIVEEIVKTLKGLRVSGCVVNVHIARSVMIAIIGKCRSQLLDVFSCSENYVHQFLDSTLNWTTCQATRAAKKIPENASELCERTFFRLAHAIEHQDIPAKLIINYDQTGVYIRPNSSQTFEVRGSKQVLVLGNGKKRAYTLGIATTPEGPLPLEQVWSGASPGSLPTTKADGYREAQDCGFHFTFANSKK